MKPTYHFRQAQAADAETITEFQIAMAFESEGMKLERETCHRGVRAVFEDPTKGAYTVAEETTTGLVIACTLVIPEWSDWRAGTVWWIHSVYVRPEHRRNGVFRGIYSRLKSEVDSRSDLQGLRLYVERENTRAQATYRELGMSPDHYLLYEWLKESPSASTRTLLDS